MMGDPRVAKLMQNPQVMKLLGAAFQVPGKVGAIYHRTVSAPLAFGRCDRKPQT